MSPCGRNALVLLLLLGVIQTPLCVTAGKILVWPGEFSHWLNIKTIVDELIARGHSVTIPVNSATTSIKIDQNPGYNVDIIQVPYSKKDFTDNVDRLLHYCINDLPNANMIQAFLKIGEMLSNLSEQNQALCRELFAREDLLEKWRKERFDVLLTDPVNVCGDLLAQKLNLPFIYSLRGSFGGVWERQCGQLPAPPSYVPGVGLGYTDQMDFLQRVKNMLFIISQDIGNHLFAVVKLDDLVTEIMGKY